MQSVRFGGGISHSGKSENADEIKTVFGHEITIFF